MEQAERRSYEVGFMVRDEKGVAEVQNHIKAHGGEILLEGPVEQVALAYKIKKQSQAHFGYLHFSLAASEVKGLNDDLERAQNVLRFLLITPPFEKQKPRMMPQDRVRQAPHTTQPQASAERKPAPQAPLSNEALEKKIEEILQQA